MIRIFRLVFLGLLGLVLLVLALANRGPVEVRLLPSDLAALTGLSWAVTLPLFLVIFAGIVLGIVIGFVWEWFREHGYRASASARAREIARLERDLKALRAEAAGPDKDDVLALLERR